MSDSRLTEEQARQLWERASQLQEEARRREEEKLRALPPGDERRSGFELEHVRQAAVEAGIEATFVDAAWRDAQAGVVPAKPSMDRKITRFLGGEYRALEVARLIDATPAEVLEAVHDVFTSDACKLALSDQIGGHPLEGGTLVFIPSTTDYTNPIGKAVMWSDMKNFLVSLSDRGGDGGGPTELHIRAPLEYSRKLNYGVGSILGGVVTAGGTAGAVAGTVALGLALPLVAVSGAGALALTWWGSNRGYRKLWKRALDKGREGLDYMLRQVAVHVETRSHRSGSRSLPPGTDAND